MLCSTSAMVLAVFLQGALFSLPNSLPLPEGLTAVQVYRNSEETVFVGTPGGDCRVLDNESNTPEAYFMVYPRAFHPGESLENYGEVVYRDADIAITLPDPGSVPTPTSAARLLREMRAPANYGLIPDAAGFDDDVAEIVASISQDSIISIVGRLEQFENRFWSNDSFPAARDWAVNWLVREGCPVEIQNFPISGDSSQNIIVTYPGTANPERIYLFGAHLDCGHNDYEIFPGADDNASGAAAVMEAARAMVKYNFDSTVILCLWGGEEAGLVGSNYYAEQAWMNGDSIIAALNLDMILYGPEIGPSDYSILNINHTDFAEDLADYFISCTNTYVPQLDTHKNFTYGGGSDHVSFWVYGFTAIGGDEYLFPPWYHTSEDLLENYMEFFPFGTEIAKATSATLASLAVPNSPSGIEEGPLNPGLTLKVSPSPASSAAYVETAANASISVFDFSGRVVLREQAQQGTTPLDVSGLPPGIYLVTVGLDNRSCAGRLVICR
ncbi:MAG TPA: M20/M25/M40 family metallo-hydrolase [Candidatus Sabulitectum sp.]|nr:M20/M25/M40 family metallo-hydrolase [Candidatus Sabulitectum sp.]HPJ28808.1 M20/M25/M40 family metallo-hydrolase [Candidatus Sabulitectum sp.]HPR23212.1 M20/M25/M40 family metallo-hydrolase [Candidatus Sabulitectum sp.]